MTRLLVVFGAGASFDSVSFERAQTAFAEPNAQPPLAAHLFQEKPIYQAAVEHYPACRPLIWDLRGPDLTQTIEEALGRFELEVSTYPLRRRQLIAISYYLREVVMNTTRRWHELAAGVTNYVKLVDELEKWKAEHRGRTVAYATFNYDTLLEQAVSDITGRTFDRVDAWTDGDDPIFKLHGSINWGREVMNPEEVGFQGPHFNAEVEARNLRTELATFGGWERTTPPFDMTLRTVFEDESRPIYCMPGLAIPTINKSTFSMPDQHLAELRAVIHRADRLLFIGWAGADRHFVDLLGELGPPVRKYMIVAGHAQAADQASGRIADAARTSEAIPIHYTFSTLLDEGLNSLLAFLNESSSDE